MASVDGRIRRDDGYIEGVLFSDGSTRAELDECAVMASVDGRIRRDDDYAPE
jgi:hypothetical protein